MLLFCLYLRSVLLLLKIRSEIHTENTDRTVCQTEKARKNSDLLRTQPQTRRIVALNLEPRNILLLFTHLLHYLNVAATRQSVLLPHFSPLPLFNEEDLGRGISSTSIDYSDCDSCCSCCYCSCCCSGRCRCFCCRGCYCCCCDCCSSCFCLRGYGCYVCGCCYFSESS